LPWDKDLAFGGFFLFGQPDQQADLSITHPYPGQHKLTDRLLAIPEVGDKYRKLVRELTATVFTKEKIAARLSELETATKEARDREAKAVAARRENTNFGGFPGGPMAQPQDLRAWADKRLASVAAQLDGKSKGTIPAGFGFGPPPGGFGGPPGGMRPPRPGEVLSEPLRGALRLTEEQRKKFDELQRDTDGKIDQLLSEEQRAMFRRMREGRPGGFGTPKGLPTIAQGRASAPRGETSAHQEPLTCARLSSGWPPGPLSSPGWPRPRTGRSGAGRTGTPTPRGSSPPRRGRKNSPRSGR
jgi:hypothetical protein